MNTYKCHDCGGLQYSATYNKTSEPCVYCGGPNVKMVAEGTPKTQDMNVKITPHKPGDGGIICLPLKSNITNPSQQDWQLVKCQICGNEYWESDLARKVIKDEGLTAACTACALRAGMSGGR